MKGEAAGEGRVEVFLLDVAECAPAMLGLCTLLDANERERAEAFRLVGAREEFVLGRAVLRSLLGRRLGVAPREVEISYGPAGKPGLADEARSLWFNVSHSGGVVALALSDGGEVGIDLERVDDSADVVELARTAWSEEAAGELAAIALPEERRLEFFRRWTCFEAAAKYSGQGLCSDTCGKDMSRYYKQPFVLENKSHIFVGCIVCGKDFGSRVDTWLSLDDVRSLP